MWQAKSVLEMQRAPAYHESNYIRPNSILLKCRYWIYSPALPTLPSLSQQIQRGINRFCKDCGVSVDSRSRRCSACHLFRVMNQRYPPEKRPRLTCVCCGCLISYRGAKGFGRCRGCYLSDRRNATPRAKRSADRPFSGTAYHDLDGNARYADDAINGWSSLASSWGALRRCWKL